MIPVPHAVMNDYVSILKVRHYPPMVFSDERPDGGGGKRRTATLSSPWVWLAKGAVLCCPQGKNPQESHLTHLPPLLCHPSASGWLRYPSYSDSAGAHQPEDNDDLYSLRAGEDCKRAEKPAGFLIPCIAGYIFSIKPAQINFQLTSPINLLIDKVPPICFIAGSNVCNYSK